MSTSETFLNVLAIRLAVLVLFGLAPKVLTPHPQHQGAAPQVSVGATERAPVATRARLDEPHRDRFNHD